MKLISLKNNYTISQFIVVLTQNQIKKYYKISRSFFMVVHKHSVNSKVFNFVTIKMAVQNIVNYLVDNLFMKVLLEKKN